MSQGQGGAGGPSRVTDEDVLRVLHAHSEPVATAPDLAAVLDVSAETVRRRLSNLHEEELVARKQAGARAVVWWPVEDRDAPAGPLRGLVGLLDEETARQARERSDAWREAFDGRMN
jgi:hypothetical protein